DGRKPARSRNKARDKTGQVARLHVPLAHLNQIDAGADRVIGLSLEREAFVVNGARAWREHLAMCDQANQGRREGHHGRGASTVGGGGAVGVSGAVRRPVNAPTSSRNPAMAVMTPTPVTAPRT